MGRRTTSMPTGRVGWLGGVRPGAVWLVVLVAGVTVLSGCQSDATPPATPSPSVTVSSASPSPSVSSPSPSASPSVEIPAAARVKSEKGAEAFVRYFFDQVNAAWTDSEPWPD